MSSVISGIEKIANEAGYNLVISQSLESEKKEIVNIKTMFNTRVDGLLVSLAYDTQDDSHFKIFLDKNIPLIFFDRVFEHPLCTNVVIDNYSAGYAMTKHLIQQGCKRIVHITANIKRNVYAERLQGYKQALTDHGITPQDNMIFINSLGDKDCTDVTQAILQMDPRPDAIFCSNDSCAVVCVRELKKAGVRIPEDIAIAGFNNEPVSTVIEPNLTTIHYPGQEMGETCASILIRKLTKSEGASLNTVVLRHELIIRESSTKNRLI
jgi:LacI family transcriptional regulator